MIRSQARHRERGTVKAPEALEIARLRGSSAGRAARFAARPAARDVR